MCLGSQHSAVRSHASGVQRTTPSLHQGTRCEDEVLLREVEWRGQRLQVVLCGLGQPLRGPEALSFWFAGMALPMPTEIDAMHLDLRAFNGKDWFAELKCENWTRTLLVYRNLV